MSQKESYAEVLLFQNVGREMETLTYRIPNNTDLCIGKIVEIPLRNKKTKGLVYNLHSEKPSYRTREIACIVENAPHLSKWQVELMEWISKYYFCPLFKVLKLFLPSSLIKKKKIWSIKPAEIQPFKLKFKHSLNGNQLGVLKQFKESKKRVALLHGITGSGKTEIYLHTVEEILKAGKQVLILIPEISLSPQMQQRFEDHFNEKTSVLHSQLTLLQKEEAWLNIYKGNTKIIIGSRSALFAPFQNLGCIIIDEEHDYSYKQDQTPRYHAVTVAKKMAEMLDIKVLMGSATPSLESYYLALKGKYEHMSLTERPGKNTKLPRTKIVDLRQEIMKKNFSIFSILLQDQIGKKIMDKEQSILFLNRRGAASAVICRVCGYVQNCSRCDIPMTYHKKFSVEGGTYNTEKLICHHCGNIGKVPKSCPNCGSPYIKYIGLGTQKVEEELQKLFPAARIVRADRDTTKRRNEFKHIYNSFISGKADILVGTQMIAIGLHLPKVNLVGVVLADLGLTLPNFRSSEQTFQLLTQVTGRSGRGETTGDAVIQTYLPNHYAIQSAAKHDYHGFYEKEINIRKELRQPPFSKLIKLTIKDINSKKCMDKTMDLYNGLKIINNELAKSDRNEINYYPALIPKLKNTYRWHILLSGKAPARLLEKISPDMTGNLIIDVDPVSTI